MTTTMMKRVVACGMLTTLMACGATSSSNSGPNSGAVKKGDFTRDGKINAADFALVAKLGKFNQGATFEEGDVNGDGIFDILDVAAMLAGAEDSTGLVGDANRDGTVDILDVAQVLAAGKFANGQAATWEQGDFNGDGKVTDDDMGLLQAATKRVGTSVPGDCTGDGKADGADLNKLIANFDKFDANSKPAAAFDCDFNDDKTIDILDAAMVQSQEISFGSIISPGNNRPGDANGDGKVDQMDALQLLGNGKYDKGSIGATWSDGDFNGDSMVDILDYATLLANMDVQTRTPGDANGDGKLDATDVAQILSAGKYDTGAVATFEQGDFNQDGVFDILDWSLVLASGAKFD